MLKISLFGKIKIEYMNEQLDTKLSNKTIALIYLLIANKGKYVSKDQLMFYLWPESAEDAARYNLRYNLWILKKILPQAEDGSSLILVDKDTCILNENYPLECDLLTIKELDEETADIEQLIHAKSLFCGNIMEGWYLKNCSEFNEIILSDRMLCERRRTKILHVLAKKYELNEQYEKALEVLNEEANIEPENEEIALHIMELYTLLGQRTAAINYYKHFESTLWNSLKITPNQKITELYRKLHLNVRMNPIAMGQHKRNNAKKEVNINGYCMPNVEYFLISDILFKLGKTVEHSVLVELDKNLIEDLSYICRAFPTFCEDVGRSFELREENVPTVRIIQAFCALIEFITGYYTLNITIKNIKDIDDISKKILDYLQNQEFENLKIIV